MKGIEISKAYFNEYGLPMLNNDFLEILPYLCVGLVGSGSDCYGFDDETSRDHDFEPGFCIFLPDEDVIDRRTEFLLERAYAKLPKEFMGLKRSLISPVGGRRNGVIRISDFYLNKIGCSDGNLNVRDWLTVSESYLLKQRTVKYFLIITVISLKYATEYCICPRISGIKGLREICFLWRNRVSITTADAFRTVKPERLSLP